MGEYTRISKKPNNIPVSSFVKPSTFGTNHGFPLQNPMDETVPTMEEIKAQRMKKDAHGYDYLKRIKFGTGEYYHSNPLVLPKLTIGQPNDKYEQEADQVASQVVNQINSPPNTAQKQETPEEEEELQTKSLSDSIQRQQMPEEEEEIQTKSLSDSIQRQEMPEEEEEIQTKSLSDSIQRQEMPEEEEEVQTKSSGQTSVNDNSGLEQSIQQSRGSGQALDDNIRPPMENAFGANFGGVRIHTDSNSDMMNRSIQARAFTTGQDVFFRQGEYNPSSRGGQELLAHELTHVVQQNSGEVRRSPSMPLRRSPQNLIQLKCETCEAEEKEQQKEQTGALQRKFVVSQAMGQEILQRMPKVKPDSISIEEAKTLLSKANKELAFELVQTAVDIAGIADPTPISDGISAAMSLAAGDYLSAGLSILSMIPYLGDAVGKPIKAVRNGKKILKLRKEIAELIQIINKIDPQAIKQAQKTKEAVSQEIKTVFQKTVKKTEKTITNTDLKPWKKGAFHGTKPKYVNPGHHDPSKNFRGGGSKTSILTNDAEEVYKKAIPSPDGKTWWGRNSQGEYYRYQSSNGKVHWNGREQSERGLKVPNDIKKRFEGLNQR